MDRSLARLAEVRAAVLADPDHGNAAAHAATLELLDRVERADAGRFLVGWEQFPEAAAGLVGEPDWPMTVGVMANMIAMVGLAEPEDHVTLHRLVGHYGHRRVAAVQTTVDELLGTGEASSLASRFAWKVARTQRTVERLVARGTDHEHAVSIAHRCYRSGYWLMMADVDPDAPGPELTSVEEAVRCADHGGIVAWRAQIAIAAANPWAPYPTELVKLLRAGDRAAPADAVESAIKYYREMSERRDRQLVAREVRRLVAMSGLSQRQFAALCGTSAPRLSTYVNGLVTPSASMMVRFARVSERAQRPVQGERGSTA